VRFLEILKQNGKVLWTSLTTICSKGIFQHDIATPLQLNELASLAEIRHHHRATSGAGTSYSFGALVLIPGS
jgi:hypothetical protein